MKSKTSLNLILGFALKTKIATVLILIFCLLLGYGCKTIQKEKQSEKSKVETSVKEETKTSSVFSDKSQSAFEINERSGIWTFEEWYQAPALPDGSAFPAAGAEETQKSTKTPQNGTGWSYRKTSFTNTDKSSKGQEQKDISLKRDSSGKLEAKADSVGKSDNKQVVATPDYGWILPCAGIGVLIGFVTYVWYRRTRPVAKIIRMIPDNYKDV